MGKVKHVKLVLDSFGSFLGRDKGCLIVRDKDKNEERYPLFDNELGEIQIRSGNTVSSGALATCGFWNIDVLIMTGRGHPYMHIYHNNFINNPQASLPSSHNNKWDNDCEGNFWSDFAGSDSNGDGIGDTPYVMDGSNQDNYPLMNPYWNPMDINHDLKVDIFDVVLACVAYSSTPSDSNWNCHGDIAPPYGVIDIFDIVVICVSYGEEYTP